MRKTLLLVFIHGFKGGDDTFGTFPEHLRALVSHALPQINVVAVQYPRFETRGELKECVARFREWLENKVIDLEVLNHTPSPTIDPSVHTILIGHSMGGIVAAETLLLLANERPIRPSASSTNPAPATVPSHASAPTSTNSSHPRPVTTDGSSTPAFMFPHIQAVLAFDTPYLGLAPEMVAHGLEGGHKMAASAWETANEFAGIFGYGSKAPVAGKTSPDVTQKPVAALPAPVKDASADAAATPRWQSWGKYAMFAGAAGAVAAGGAAALYSQREKISAGWGWATSHLLFVGDLAKPELLRKRVATVEQTVGERGLGGFGNFYTNLGRGAREGYGITDQFSGRERTFCNLPKAVKENSVAGKTKSTDGQNVAGKLRWMKAVNEKATDETTAHVSMFFPRENPGFYNLGESSGEVISSWVDQGWYATSDGPAAGLDTHQPGSSLPPFGSLGKDWEGLDRQDAHDADGEDVEMKDQERQDRDELEDSVLIENMRSSGHLSGSDGANKDKSEVGNEPLIDLSDQNAWRS